MSSPALTITDQVGFDDPGPTVRFGRLEHRQLLLGLSSAQTACVAVALTAATAGLYTAGALGLLLTLPVAGPAAVLGLLHRDGKPLVTWLPVAAHWRLRLALRTTRHRTDPRRTRSAPVLQLPGDLARLRLLTSPSEDGGANGGTAYVHDPTTGTLTAVLRVTPPPFLLADPGTQHHLVDGYSRLLAALGQQPALRRIQILERTAADHAHELRDWWHQHGVQPGSWAASVVADLVADAGEVSDRHETYLAVTFDIRHTGTRAGRRARTDPEAAVIRCDIDLAAIGSTARIAEFTEQGWLDPGGLERLVRTGYDPALTLRSAPPVDRAARDETVDGSLSAGEASHIGPTALDEDWDRLRADGAHHAVYWIAEWPRSEVTAAFLQPLILIPGVRRALSIVAEPLPMTRALRDIRRTKAEHAANATQRARLGQVGDEAADAETADVIRRERELAGGHADLRFTGLLAVSAHTDGDLDRACGLVEQAAAQAQCDLRRLYGQQAQGFAAAALPLARGLA